MNRLRALVWAGNLLRFVPLAFAPAPLLASPDVTAASSDTVVSAKSGAWSDPTTWDLGRIPGTGDRVLIRSGHQVEYDVASTTLIRLLQIAGKLEFSTHRDTELNVGLIKVIGNEDLSEEGFDCHAAPQAASFRVPRPEFLVGTATRPIPAQHRAVVRLHYIEGMDKESCPAIVCCGGRMEFHGAPLTNTWVRLSLDASQGADRVFVNGSLDGWNIGDRVIVTGTRRRREGQEESQTEEHRVAGFGEKRSAVSPGDQARPSDEYPLANTPPAPADPAAPRPEKLAIPARSSGPISNGQTLLLEGKLRFEHDGHGDYHGEVANLSRNVVIESADPGGVRGHTMYHVDSQGSISYAEFRHLGKKGVLGRYGIHFHLVRDTMRGSFVKGASIWDSENRWVVVHGSNYLVISDCVGYQSTGHGYFLEDGSEVFNAFDGNLAVLAIAGSPLPKQVMAFDANRGAGFWWANCHNVFCNNVAADCDEYGFRFDVKRTDQFDPFLSVLEADGSHQVRDVRSLPFIRFENNESQAIKSFGMSLRGFPLDDLAKQLYSEVNLQLLAEVRESSPDVRYPFWIRNFRAWETTFGYHAGTDGVFIDGLKISRSGYGMWRVVLDRNVWRDVAMTDIGSKQLHMPFTLGPPQGPPQEAQRYFVAIQGFVDDFAPHTVITKAVRVNDEVLIAGCSYDTSKIKQVLVNGRKAYSTRGDFAEWEVVFGVPAENEFAVSAWAEDLLGNVEPRPHAITLAPLSEGAEPNFRAAASGRD